MRLGVGVLGLDRRRQRVDHALGALQAVVGGLQAQRGTGAGDQFAALHGLAHEVVGARLQRDHAVFDLVQGGDHDHRHQPAFRGRLHPPADLETVQTRHVHVEEDQVGVLMGEDLERGGPCAGGQDRAVDGGQVGLQQLPVDRVVVDHEHPRGLIRSPVGNQTWVRHVGTLIVPTALGPFGVIPRSLQRQFETPATRARWRPPQPRSGTRAGKGP